MRHRSSCMRRTKSNVDYDYDYGYDFVGARQYQQPHIYCTVRVHMRAL